MKNYKNNINASSMADIAFLLLIFFLVTTTIDQDKGILNKLPGESEEKKATVLDRNVLELNINSLDQIMLEGKISEVKKVKEFTKRHVLNFGEDLNYSETPKQAVVLLESDRGASYDLYIQVQNELKLAYNEIRNEQTLTLSNGAYSYVGLKNCIEKANKQSLKCKDLRATIKKDFPMVLLEK